MSAIPEQLMGTVTGLLSSYELYISDDDSAVAAVHVLPIHDRALPFLLPSSHGRGIGDWHFKFVCEYIEV